MAGRASSAVSQLADLRWLALVIAFLGVVFLVVTVKITVQMARRRGQAVRRVKASLIGLFPYFEAEFYRPSEGTMPDDSESSDKSAEADKRWGIFRRRAKSDDC